MRGCKFRKEATVALLMLVVFVVNVVVVVVSVLPRLTAILVVRPNETATTTSDKGPLFWSVWLASGTNQQDRMDV